MADKVLTKSPYESVFSSIQSPAPKRLEIIL